MTNVFQTPVIPDQFSEFYGLPLISTVNNLPAFFPSAALTVSAIQGHIFKAADRFDSKGRKIPGNGLAATGAIIHIGRKVLINVKKYADWLSGEIPREQQSPVVNRNNKSAKAQGGQKVGA